MTARKSTQGAGDANVWQGFCARHKESPSLRMNPLYALSVDLIDSITRVIPNFWTSAEVLFEGDLANTVTGGVFHGRSFHCPFLATPKTPKMNDIDRRVQEMIEEEMGGHGLGDRQIQDRLRIQRAHQKDIDLRKLAYTAWLVTNPQFPKERNLFRICWDDDVSAARCFPSHGLTFFGERLECDAMAIGEEASAPERLQKRAELLMFYRRWGLRTFLTWDVPVPLDPQLFAIIYHDTADLGEAGLLLFLPWHLLRDGNINLKQLITQLRQAHRPSHLDDWFSHERKLGYTQLVKRFMIYWCLRLALKKRHGVRL